MICVQTFAENRRARAVADSFEAGLLAEFGDLAFGRKLHFSALLTAVNKAWVGGEAFIAAIGADRIIISRRP